MSNPAYDVCRGCGCTNERTCPGGCHWVKSDWCSACHNKSIKEIIRHMLDWLDAQTPGETDAKLGKHPCKVIIEEGPSLTVQDHIGAVVFQLDIERAYLAHQYEASEVIAMFDELIGKAVT